jgi:hypothetical protein
VDCAVGVAFVVYNALLFLLCIFVSGTHNCRIHITPSSQADSSLEGFATDKAAYDYVPNLNPHSKVCWNQLQS